LFGALLLLTSVALQAQEEPARFLLEMITVEGPREAAGRIIEAETLLRAGQSYTEADLGQAVARVQRLPFVLDADFSLRKGSALGSQRTGPAGTRGSGRRTAVPRTRGSNRQVAPSISNEMPQKNS
jgi:hypothetical protein